jgi:hypothetical protein
MAAVSLPELPETSRTGTPGFPELPAPPLGGGRNGKDERDGVALDLFGLAQAPPRILGRKEAAALLEVLQALRAHPAVAWCERMNSGAVRIGGRFVRFGWPGCPDVLGQLTDGRLIGCEVKGPTGRLRPAQVLFLERIRAAGGVAFVARNCRDVLRELKESK